ncbi:tellurite-resistance/dicarboxylate transporter (TDT) family protein [Abortiporus biennis]
MASISNWPRDRCSSIFFVLDMIVFVINTMTLLLQLILYPQRAKRLITDPTKNIFVPLMVLHSATLIIGASIYARQGINISADVIYILFWAYVVFAIIVCFPMLMIWFNQPHDLTKFSPAWAFLIFPMMLVGVVAYNVLRVMEPTDPRARGILITAYIFQGLGFFMTLFYICIYIIRIMMTGFLEGPQASGAFVACGPPGFTAISLINLAEESQPILKSWGVINERAGEVWYATSILAALMLFGLAIFFFAFGALPFWFKWRRHLSQILSCWALTFPNVGWILTVRKIGDIFDLNVFKIWYLVMIVIMCVTWTILFVFTAIAFCRGKIFMTPSEEILRDLTEKEREEDIERALYTNGSVAMAIGMNSLASTPLGSTPAFTRPGTPSFTPTPTRVVEGAGVEVLRPPRRIHPYQHMLTSDLTVHS